MGRDHGRDAASASSCIGTAVLRSELFSIRSAAAEVDHDRDDRAARRARRRRDRVGGAALHRARHAPAGAARRRDAGAARRSRRSATRCTRASSAACSPASTSGAPAGSASRAIRSPPTPPTAIAEATRRIAAIGDGADVRWMPAAGAPGRRSRDALRAGEPLRTRRRSPTLPACFIVPALGADRTLVGAFFIDGGLIDRDTYLVARDLAARVALAVERAEAVSALDDARRLAALGQFAAAIAHDIRTPLTSISLNVQILRRKLQLSDDDREHLDIALEELARLDRSVAEILDFAKPVKLAAEPIDVGELIETTAQGPVAGALREGRRGSSCEPPRRRCPLTVQGDPQRLRQVLDEPRRQRRRGVAARRRGHRPRAPSPTTATSRSRSRTAAAASTPTTCRASSSRSSRRAPTAPASASRSVTRSCARTAATSTSARPSARARPSPSCCPPRREPGNSRLDRCVRTRSATRRGIHHEESRDRGRRRRRAGCAGRRPRLLRVLRRGQRRSSC